MWIAEVKLSLGYGSFSMQSPPYTDTWRVCIHSAHSACSPARG